MPIKFFTEDTKFNLKNKNRIKNWVNSTITSVNKKTGNINFIFTSDKHLLKINKEYLSHKYYTDIITFNYCENEIVSGDIFISIETIKYNSSRFNVAIIEELHRVIIHGVLHLLGFDDQSDEEKDVMREKENYYLERLKNLS
ncbi:MAG: rRNA maturation RNase YbeY [Bacteroidales bacterium]|nr:rRNA maturation RNase YbeY [Bacteroidales bacterium]